MMLWDESLHTLPAVLQRYMVLLKTSVAREGLLRAEEAIRDALANQQH